MASPLNRWFFLRGRTIRTAIPVSRWSAFWTAFFLLLPGIPLFSAETSAPQEHIEFFEKKIRPVLDAHCYKCHSENAEKAGKLKGGLKLDSAQATRQGGESGPAVVPRDTGKSLLVSALRHEAFEMPPERKLAPNVIQDFVHWIELGAPDPREGRSEPPAASKPIDFNAARKSHWAFRPPQPVQAPTVLDTQWPRTDIDRFVLSKLETEGMRPVPNAPKREWIRRVFLTLTGLPPSSAEIESFERDTSPDPRATVVDRLLSSQAYAERWARHWLDVARYSEDQALAAPKDLPFAYRYRDWVIHALRTDMPYDRFITLQLAGDLLEEPETDLFLRYAGLGFQGMGQLYHRGSFPEQVMADELDDRVDVVSRGLLGLTVSCARCHDHKYDPIPTRDYYSLAAAYFGSELYERPTAAPEVVTRHENFIQEKKNRTNKVTAWMNEQREDLARAALEHCQKYMEAASILVARAIQKLPADTAAMANERGISTYFLQRWVDLLVKNSIPDPLRELRAWHRECHQSAHAPGAAEWAKNGSLPGSVSTAILDVTQPATKLVEELDRVFGKRQTAVDAAARKEQSKPSPPVKLANEQGRWATVFFKQRGSPFFVSDEALPGMLADGDRVQLEQMQTELDAFRKTEPPAPPLTQSIRGGGVAMPVYVRGSVDRKGEIAPPGFLQILRPDSETHADAAPASAAFNRLDLARAIASRDNPLTARVIVNRVWHHYFGRGLVSTPSNFGTLGDPPSHPELLDYLAVEFMNHGWSLRWLLREISLSRVTGLLSTADPANMNRDPGNRLLWRWAPRRLDFEAWRDSILLVSGLLDRSEGGPSLPVDEHSRRTIYSKISRSKLDPTLMAFDFPDANVSNEKRSQTMVPQQQLYAINSPFLTKAAKALAKRIESAAQDDPARVIAAYRLAHGRNPGKDEQEFVLRYLSSVRMNPGDQLQPWERVAHAMLAANEISWLP